MKLFAQAIYRFISFSFLYFDEKYKVAKCDLENANTEESLLQKYQDSLDKR